jgi:hypothetical protein
MDKMGWKESAALMRRWFANPLYKMPDQIRGGKGIDYRILPAAQIDDQIIKMSWLLGFPRIKAVFDELYLYWASAAGMGELKSKLLSSGWQLGQTMSLGHGLNRALDLDMVCQVNSRGIGAYADTFDNLFGAIFKATLKLAVVGTAHYDTARRRNYFKVEQIGIYLRDTYDFNADWRDGLIGLGVWSQDRLLSKNELLEYQSLQRACFAKNIILSPPACMLLYNKYQGFSPVMNKDFRDWQDKHGTGGDFFVFSDVKWMKVNVPEIPLI